MTEQVLPALTGDPHVQLRHMRPVELQRRPRFARLREKHLLARTMLSSPAEHPALERAQGPLRLRRRLTRQQVLEQRFRLQLRCVFEHPLGVRPDCRQWIRPPPAPRLFRLRSLPARQILGRRLPVHPGFDRGRAQHRRLRVCFHQSLVLLLGNHGPA